MFLNPPTQSQKRKIIVMFLLQEYEGITKIQISLNKKEKGKKKLKYLGTRDKVLEMVTEQQTHQLPDF